MNAILTLPPVITRSQISAAALVLLCFTGLYVLLIFVLPPSATQIQAADPLVIFLLPLAGTNTLTFFTLAFMMAAHCSAHILIALLFTAADA